MKTVWLLWGSDGNTPWLISVFVDKVLCEAHLRHEAKLEEGKGYIFWIQEKQVTK